MGLFKNLRSKSKQVNTIILPKDDFQECDFNKTKIIVDLFKIPNEKRDDNWTKALFENIKTASFKSGDPQILNGPDGFRYFILRTPESNQPFESYCIQNMKDEFLLDKGLGVVINPDETSVDCVFSYGDIVNLHINNELFTPNDNLQNENEITIPEEGNVLLTQPSERILPKKARNQLKQFLISKGVHSPQVMMIWRKCDGQLIRELAFNIFIEDFETTEQVNFMLDQIGWFLPRQYAVISLTRNSHYNTNFTEL